jgi:aspartyl-tRNA synthetase
MGKNIVFATLRDFDGNFTQIVSKDTEIVALIDAANVEDCVAIKGTVVQRRTRSAEDQTIRWDLKIDEFKTLNSSDVLTSQLESLKATPNDFPPQYRYLQLRLPFYQQALRKRAKAATVVRSELGQMGFTEVETPLLFKSTPEGAREFLVPTRRVNQFYALPQSPQQYKQLLMASGVKNYFQIARCFRDEDLRADRQPEFTQVDLEMSFADAKDVQDTVERVVKRIWKEVAECDIFTVGVDCVQLGDFTHLSYEQVLSKYGIDKPDLRSTLEFQNLEGLATAIENPDFPVFEVCVLRGAFEGKAKLPQKLFDGAEYRNRKPIVIPIKTEDDLQHWYKKFTHMAEFHDIKQVNQTLDLRVGDVIAGSTRSQVAYENPTPLGRFRQLAISEFPDKWRHDVPFVGVWVEDFPLFNPTELSSESKQDYPQYDRSVLESTHHPFTMAKPEDYELLETDPLAVKGEHYDLVVNGVELGGGSRRVHDAEVQRYILDEILKVPNPDRLFGHLLKALSMGCPPHAGLALGFDRLCAMLIGSSSIRDVVAFPKTQNGSDPVVESPSSVSDNVLKEYHIKKV